MLVDIWDVVEAFILMGFTHDRVSGRQHRFVRGPLAIILESTRGIGFEVPPSPRGCRYQRHPRGDGNGLPVGRPLVVRTNPPLFFLLTRGPHEGRCVLSHAPSSLPPRSDRAYAQFAGPVSILDLGAM